MTNLYNWSLASKPIPELPIPFQGAIESFGYQTAAVQQIIGPRRHSYCAHHPGCIAGDAIIKVMRHGKVFPIKMRDLYRKFNELPGRDPWTKQGKCSTKSLFPNGEIRHNEILKVVNSGVKATVTLTLASGKTLKCTPDHEIHTPTGWMQASRLLPGDKVHTNGIEKGVLVDADGYRTVRMPEHRRANKDGRVYQHNLIAEATIGRPLLDYESVHHKDFDKGNNAPDNLQVMLTIDHLRLHGALSIRKRFDGCIGGKGGEIIFYPREDSVASVEYAGQSDTYDIVMAEPARSFVASGIIVHNSGKTPIALVASLAYEITDPVLVICPPSISYQWAKKAYEWTGLPWIVATSTVEVREFLANPRKHVPSRFIVPDSLIHEIPDVDDRFSLLVVDEAHRLKTRDSRRTRAVFGGGMDPFLAHRCDKILCMSGTPMPATPIDLYPFLNTCAPDIAPNFAVYSERYCPGQREWVWRGNRRQEIITYKTAINKDELARKLRETSLIRPTRADILSQLPAMREEVYTLTLGIKTGRSVETILADWKKYGDKDPALATERKDLGELKAKAILPYLETVIDGGDCPVIWTWHRKAAEDIALALKLPLVIGGLCAEDYRDSINRFTSGDAKAIVCTIGAAGTGIDGFQHRTDLAIFVESHYGEVEMEQAIGRIWRTGQRNSVRIVYVVADHAIDQAIDEARSRKRTDVKEIIGA